MNTAVIYKNVEICCRKAHLEHLNIQPSLMVTCQSKITQPYDHSMLAIHAHWPFQSQWKTNSGSLLTHTDLIFPYQNTLLFLLIGSDYLESAKQIPRFFFFFFEGRVTSSFPLPLSSTSDSNNFVGATPPPTFHQAHILVRKLSGKEKM